MNKLYKAGLAVLAIALLTSSALAFSPSWDTVPDVIVGDGDLVFTNAFNWHDYVSDQDTSPVSLLQVVFAEGAWQDLGDRSLEETDGSTTNEVGINGQAEVDYSGVGGTPIGDPLTINGSTILNGTGWLTFTASSAADRAVVLIASDGATSPSGSNAFRVREIASEVDQLTFPTQVITLDGWDVDGDWSADWVWLGAAPMSSVASGGSIGITTTLAANNNFSNWQLSNSATKIPITAGQIIRGRYTINGGSAVAAAWPAVQMRFFQQSNAEFQWTNVSSNGYVPAASASRTYESFMAPSANLPTAELNTALFVIDTDAAHGGTFSMESLSVDGIVGLDGLFTPVSVIDSGESLDFTSVFDFNFTTDIAGSGNADSFTYNVTGLTGLGNFEIAQINTGVTMASNTLYRVVNTVSSSVTPINQPQFELRAFPADNSLVIVTQDVGTSAGSAHMPDSGGKDYGVYIPSTGIDGQELRISFDIINNDASRAGAMTWDRVVIESVPLTSIP
jgi:hypothetical protein